MPAQHRPCRAMFVDFSRGDLASRSMGGSRGASPGRACGHECYATQLFWESRSPTPRSALFSLMAWLVRWCARASPCGVTFSMIYWQEHPREANELMRQPASQRGASCRTSRGRKSRRQTGSSFPRDTLAPFAKQPMAVIVISWVTSLVAPTAGRIGPSPAERGFTAWKPPSSASSGSTSRSLQAKPSIPRPPSAIWVDLVSRAPDHP